MADYTSPIQPIEAATNVATRLNENFDAASPAMLYGRDARTTTGLTWGYIGGRFGGALITSGTVTLDASTTSYLVAAQADGAVSVSDTTTDWDDADNFLRLYKITTGAAAVTGYEDHRQAIGVTGGGGAIVAADISDSTTVGRAVITAVDELAARTAMGAGTSNFSGDYDDLSGAPTLGTAAALNVAASGNAAAGEVVKGDDTRLTASLTNPMTDAGDLIVGGASGAPTRLGISTNGYVLTLDTGMPVWSPATGGSFTGGALTSALNEAKGADIARATTTNIGAATGNFVHLTGTTTVTGLGTVQAGTRRVVRFAGAGTLTHNATSLILPGAANITTAANDCAIFVSEGSGNWRCVAYTKANGQSVIVPAATVTGFAPSLATSSPNNTINASRLLASGGTTNQDFVLQAKGTGAILAQLPDGTGAGGNKRGTFAVDFQLSRSLAAQVASGPYSFLGGGLNNSATGESSGVVAGGGNSATAYGAVVAGGSENDANGANSFIGGGAGATTRGIFAAHAHAGGGVWGPGTSQTCVYVVSTNTGGATEGTLSISGTVGPTQSIVLPDVGAYCFEAQIVARKYGTEAVAGFKVVGCIKRQFGAASTAIVGTPAVTVVSADTDALTWSVSAVANTTDGSLEFKVTGAAASSIRWVGRVVTTELVGAA